MFKRLLFVGCSGSGKSTVSRKLQSITKIPVIHLDQIYWQANWQKKERSLFLNELTQELMQPEWIIDGNFDSTLELRLQYADCIIFLDDPRWLCIAGILKRFIQFKEKTRPDMAVNCEGKIDLEFLRYIWAFNDTTRPHLVEQLKKSQINSIVFKNRRQLKKWLSAVEEKSDAKLV